MKEEWRKQMQQKLADYEESDIDLSWEEIDKALEANRLKAMEADRRNAKTIALWPRRIAAAAVVLLLSGIGYWTLQRQKTEMIEKDGMQTVLSEAIPSLTPIKDGNPAPQTPSKRMTALANIVSIPKNAAIAPKGQVCDSDFVCHQATCPLDSTTDRNTDNPAMKSTTKTISKSQPQPTVIYPSDLHKRVSSGDRLTAKVYYSNTTTGYSSLLSSTQQIPIPPGKEETNPSYPYYQGETDVTISDGGNEHPYGYTDGENGDDDNTDQQNGNTRQGETQKYRTQQTDETTHHHQPIRLGLSLRYRLNDHWSIESGLTYTRLSSDFTKTVDGTSTTTEQHLTYIGIPISVSYRLWGNRYLNVYLSAGGMVEKMVKGSQQTSNMTTSVSIHPLQFSLSSTLGAEFNISRQFSLYAEPGLGYWFDNGSSISTYYQDKPLSFSLNLGIRVNPW